MMADIAIRHATVMRLRHNIPTVHYHHTHRHFACFRSQSSLHQSSLHKFLLFFQQREHGNRRHFLQFLLPRSALAAT